MHAVSGQNSIDVLVIFNFQFTVVGAYCAGSIFLEAPKNDRDQKGGLTCSSKKKKKKTGHGHVLPASTKCRGNAREREPAEGVGLPVVKRET